jgi:CRP-like cAMP-binding protein
VRGSLQVSKGEQHIATIRSDLGPGQIVGEIGFFIGIQQPYTVVASAKSEVTLVTLSAGSFE